MASINDKDEYFCKNYFVLRPEEASFLDFLRFLVFPSDSGARGRSVHCPEEEEFEEKLTTFRRRWIIFASLVLQKLLLLGKKRLSSVGHRFEMWLNLLDINGGALGLLKNILKGKVQHPNSDSALYASVIGHLDHRTELDRNIVHGDPKYNTALSVMAAKLSYENANFVDSVITQHWEMECLGNFNFWNDLERENSTGVVVFRNQNLIVVAFRGTRPFAAGDWRTDVDISWYEIDGVGRAHRGFMEALGWPKETHQGQNGQNKYAYYELRTLLKEKLFSNTNGETEEDMKFIVTGHSLGGALAVLFASVLAIHGEDRLLERLEGVYTFGQPRVGDGQFGEYVEGKFTRYNVKYSRYVYGNDIVPRSPFDDKVLMFKHFGSCLYYNSWFYQGKVLEEEPNKNYFSPLWAIPKVLNAAWEFIRGFILQYTKGHVYRERWLLKSMRLIGLSIPGIPAHCPQDYVNLTRLGPHLSPK